MQNLNVLVLEDEPLQRLVTVTALKKVMPGQVHEAASGSEALALLEHCERMDIAICDLKMPGMDGLAFLRHARQSGKLHSVILCSQIEPILRQTTVSMIRRLGLNFLGDLGKPFNLERLTTLLTRYQNQRHGLVTALKKSELPTLADVIRGLDNGEFEPYYQPKVALDNASLQGAEALARWNHPQLGVLPPSHFLHIMEHHSLLDRLFWQLFDQGLALRRKLAQKGIPLSFSFNLHPSQLASQTLTESIAALLVLFQVPSSSITFEITETSLISAPASSLENLVRLRVMGCGLAMDDFGAGYSSLDRLCELPFSQIKLDGTFVRKMGHHPRSSAIISYTVALARSLGMSLIIEGVETREQQQRLLELGCDIAQGFVFARPMPESHFIAYCIR
ncbi:MULTISPECIES: EAL domain-containing protein [Pseudomonas chlororaphis group]|uniref:EAL domain-containing response regulator n=1 Tax=Pseudomonas chlororaphis group TaxID=136842 RepID=UPI002097ED44|nr:MULTISPECIES: EAL domain-containing response regulator [Pseudomonas chlororaphis group]MCO7578484.1 EAL domain-containing response regulator [Pseudomonas protegens]MCO7584379.1 EAL domain-containing response regulator [Pseudomonas chlororaphis]MCO7601570.1 EAL domain-containing response regulator [Pseudomonas chlororaphis]